MTQVIKVLDHGFVALRNMSGPTRRYGWYDEGEREGDGGVVGALFDADDTDPANAARMSFDMTDSGRTREQDLKLAEYLMKNKHSTPFEMIEIWLEMKMPIFVARQFVRHRTCLAAGTEVIFNRPCDGKAYPYEISRLVKNFADPAQQPRLRDMQLRYASRRGTVGVTSVEDAWFSGVKPVYEITTQSGRKITASPDHRFKCEDGWHTVADLAGKSIMSAKLAGGQSAPYTPKFSPSDVALEVWKETEDGYEVSNLGRVRSYFGQGSRVKKLTPILKSQTVNPDGRLVVGMKGRVRHVSHLVAEAFLGPRHSGMQVLHTDDNAFDNRVSNLRWGTAAENSHDAGVNGGRSKLRLTPDTVISIRRRGSSPTFDISVSSSEHNFIANGLVTHNCSINEVSGRYVTLPAEWYIPEVVGGKPVNAKQGQSDGLDAEHQEWFKENLEMDCHGSYQLYIEALERGIAAEHARMLLHLNHFTHWLWKQDLRNLMHFLALRDHSHAQVESQQYAKAVDTLIRQHLPHSMELYDKYCRLP